MLNKTLIIQANISKCYTIWILITMTWLTWHYRKLCSMSKYQLISSTRRHTVKCIFALTFHMCKLNKYVKCCPTCVMLELLYNALISFTFLWYLLGLLTLKLKWVKCKSFVLKMCDNHVWWRFNGNLLTNFNNQCSPFSKNDLICTTSHTK